MKRSLPQSRTHGPSSSADQASFLVVVLVMSFLRISFDINRWLEQREARKLERVRALCPHTVIESDGDSLRIDSLFHSPSMSRYWIYTRCGAQTLDDDMPSRLLNYYGNNLRAWVEDDKKFVRAARKAGLL